MIVRGDNQGAISAYQSILKDQPNSLEAINNLASLLLDYRTDKSDLDRAYSLSQSLKGSNVPEFKDTAGWAEYHHGDYNAAVVLLEDAQAKRPDQASIRYHLGMAYKALGQINKSSEQLNAALSLEADGSPLKEKIRSALR
jgi:tetratricopeptide (TPR) repeat protein